MIVKTADRPNAGTDANVYFQFNGERGPTPKILLQDESGAFKRFESGRADKFIVQTVDVGKVSYFIRVTLPYYTISYYSLPYFTSNYRS